MKWGRQILIIFFCVTVFFSAAAGVRAQGSLTQPVADDSLYPAGGIVPSGTGDFTPEGYGSCELVEMVNNVMQFLIAVSIIIAVIVFIFAGYLMVYSRGDAGQIQRAKGLFGNVLMGVLLLLTAYLIINTILGVLLGSTSAALNWKTIECSYANEVGKAAAYNVELTYSEVDWVVVDKYTGFSGSGGTGGTGSSGGGSCTVPSDTGNACHPNNLSCFGSKAAEASQVCSLESGGGNIKAVSGTDRCKDGTSFSGGLFQVNILAHYNNIPGCSNDFFRKNGSGTQGTCLREAGPANNPYCAVRDCEITKPQVYKACMNAVFDPNWNISYACKLYSSAGSFRDWAYSANKCGV